MVDLGGAAFALQDFDFHGQDRSDRAATQTAVDGAGADRHARRARLRLLHVFGYDHAPHGHGEVDFTNVRVPVRIFCSAKAVGSRSRRAGSDPDAFTTACAQIGVAERALEAMCARAKRRVAFGKPIAEQGVVMQWIADSRMEIEQVRLFVLKAADMMDRVGNKAARAEIAMIKVAAPRMVLRVLDRAIQAHGGAGVSQDFFLAQAWATGRTMRIVDGPDEVHSAAVAKMELRKGGRND